MKKSIVIFPIIALFAFINHPIKDVGGVGIYTDSLPKLFKVERPLYDWNVSLVKLGELANVIRQSNLPSNVVAFYTDSIIVPLQREIYVQINNQLPKPDSSIQSKKK